MCRVLLALGWALVLATSLRAELLYYDPFLIGSNPFAGEYTLGKLVGQNPRVGPIFPPFLTGPWTSNSFGPSEGYRVQAGSITASAFPARGGSVQAHAAVDGATAGRYLSMPWDSSTTGSYYLSFLVNFGASELPEDGIGFRAFEFWGNGGPIGNGANPVLMMGYSQFGLLGEREPDTARMAININGIIQVLPDAPSSFNEDGSAHFVVMKFDLSEENAADQVSVYLNPQSSQEPLLPSRIFSGIDFTLGAFGAPSWFGGTGRGPELDEIRIGTEFVDVIPQNPEMGFCIELDEACYTTIIQHMHELEAEPFDGDLNFDGRVDLRDLRIWRDNRSDFLLSSVAVPEPDAVWLLAIATIILLSFRLGVQTSCISVERKLRP